MVAASISKQKDFLFVVSRAAGIIFKKLYFIFVHILQRLNDLANDIVRKKNLIGSCLVALLMSVLPNIQYLHPIKAIQ